MRTTRLECHRCLSRGKLKEVDRGGCVDKDYTSMVSTSVDILGVIRSTRVMYKGSLI